MRRQNNEIKKHEIGENRFIYPFESKNSRGMIVESEGVKKVVKYAQSPEKDGRYLTYFDKKISKIFFMFPNSTDIYKMDIEPVANFTNSKFNKNESR